MDIAQSAILYGNLHEKKTPPGPHPDLHVFLLSSCCKNRFSVASLFWTK